MKSFNGLMLIVMLRSTILPAGGNGLRIDTNLVVETYFEPSCQDVDVSLCQR